MPQILGLFFFGGGGGKPIIKTSLTISGCGRCCPRNTKQIQTIQKIYIKVLLSQQNWFQISQHFVAETTILCKHTGATDKHAEATSDQAIPMQANNN